MLLGPAFASNGLWAFAEVYAMMLGDFDVQMFNKPTSPGVTSIAVMMFMLFMLVVAIIMLNAVIAIMGNTFDREYERKKKSGLLERATFILELEELLEPVELLEQATSRWWRVLLSVKIKHYSPGYIHVLEPVPRDERPDGDDKELEKRYKTKQKQREKQQDAERLDRIDSLLQQLAAKADGNSGGLEAVEGDRPQVPPQTPVIDTDETLGLHTDFVDFLGSLAVEHLRMPPLPVGEEEAAKQHVADRLHELAVHVHADGKVHFRSPHDSHIYSKVSTLGAGETLTRTYTEAFHSIAKPKVLVIEVARRELAKSDTRSEQPLVQLVRTASEVMDGVLDGEFENESETEPEPEPKLQIEVARREFAKYADGESEMDEQELKDWAEALAEDAEAGDDAGVRSTVKDIVDTRSE